MSSTPRLAPPRPTTLLHVAALTVPLALVVLGCKLHKVLAATTGFPLGDIVLAMAPDVVFLTLWSALWTVALHLSRGRLFWVTSVAFSALTYVMLFVGFGEHQFYLKTGSLLDAHMLAYTAENLGMLKDVLASEMGPLVWASMVLLLLIVMSPLLWRRRKIALRFKDVHLTPDHWRDPRVRAGLGALAALTLGSAVLASATIRDELQPFAGNVFTRIGKDAFGGAAGEKLPAVELGPIAPLRVERTDRTKPYNVVVIVLESARARSFTSYAPELQTTPFFSKLAERGTLYERAYTTVTHTSKALVSIQCGLFPLIDTPVDEAAADAIPGTCLAEALRGQGYATAFMQPAEENFERRSDLVAEFGFEHFQGKESLPFEGFDESNYFGWEDDVMVQPALDWIDAQRKDGKPFYLGMLTLSAHHPYTVPKGFPVQEFAKNKELNDYLNTIAYTDRFLSKLFAGFDKRGLADDTIFIVLGDHGEGMGEHGRRQHDSVIYEEGVHIPMLVLAPGVARGERRGGLRQTIDIMPTVLDGLGFDFSGGDLPGLSMLSTPGHEAVHTSCWYRDYCMAKTTEQYKIIYHYDRRKPQVFDLTNDPDEKQDLAKTTDAATVEAAIEELKLWRATANARFHAQTERRIELFVTKEPPKVENALVADLGDHVQLVGYDVESTRFRPGGRTVVTLYFHAKQDVPKGWSLFTHVLGPTFRNEDHVPVEGAYPVEQWRAGEYITDRVTITTRPDMKVGQYTVSIGLWNPNIAGAGHNQRADIKASTPGAKVDKERRLHVVGFTIEGKPVGSD